MRTLLINIFFLFTFGVLCSQNANGAEIKLPEFENDSIYKSLVEKRQEFRNKESVLNTKLDSLRNYYSAAPDSLRNIIGEKILSVESELYGIRAQIAEADQKINIVEQQYLIQSIRNEGKPDSTGTTNPTQSNFRKHRYLLNNRFLAQNLPAEEFRKLRTVQKNEPLVKQLVEEFNANYQQLDSLSREYQTVSTQSKADSLYRRYMILSEQSARLDDSLGRLWTPCYDTKIYAYSYLLDRINRTDVLEDMNNKLNEARAAHQNEDGTQLQSLKFATLANQRSVVLNYELALAEVLDLTEAADSIRTELEKIPESSNLTLRRIVLQPLDFTPYCRVTTTPTHIYTTRNPIPKHQKPEVARVYKILLGTFQKAQQPNIFRKVSPLSYERTEGGKYRYYAGLYKNYDEVMEDIERLKEIGFRRPEPVVWEDGVYRNLAEESENSYRVEFTCPGGVISNTIRALIDVFAKDKETSRINTETGVVYIIGTFDTENKAQELVDALNRMEGVNAKLTQNE